MTQHKEAKQLSFKKLSEAIDAPGEFLMSDFSKFERGPMLHLAFQALDTYQVGGLGACSELQTNTRCGVVARMSVHVAVPGCTRPLSQFTL